MIQVQDFLKNHLTKFSIGTGSGQTILSYGYYADGYVFYIYNGEYFTYTLIDATNVFDTFPYRGGNQARLDL